MRLLVIGPYFNGSTTKMRSECLQSILRPTYFKAIDVEIPQKKMNRIFTSIGWRLKKGPMITAVNKYIKEELANEEQFDIVWIEKAVFITLKTMCLIKTKTKNLIHFTPDPAFLYHQSTHFNKTLPLFDYAITTKSFEVDLFKKNGSKHTILTTQGYDATMHKPYYTFAEKKDVIFIGHYEKNRAIVLQKLIDSSIKVNLVGYKWDSFLIKNKRNPNLHFIGKEIVGDEYAKLLSRARYSIGFLSKWIPELHTTRTFEIPACGTALISESNNEIDSFFKKDIDYISYVTTDDIVNKIKYYEKNPNELELLIKNASNRLVEIKVDHYEIIETLLSKINIK